MTQFSIRSILLHRSAIGTSIALIRYEFYAPIGDNWFGLAGMTGAVMLFIAVISPFAGVFASDRDMPALLQALLAFIVLVLLVSVLVPAVR
ncbi:MAG: hypothetical protein KDB27_14820 [Planctomycetales bacterium]|nr:hypothetical protein [Planctomycetales bacterium]